MKKHRALKLLGGTGAEVARALNISRQAVHKWPDPLPPKITAKVLAAVAARKNPAPAMTPTGES